MGEKQGTPAKNRTVFEGGKSVVKGPEVLQVKTQQLVGRVLIVQWQRRSLHATSTKIGETGQFMIDVPVEQRSSVVVRYGT
jgi:hypothetical protein